MNKIQEDSIKNLEDFDDFTLLDLFAYLNIKDTLNLLMTSKRFYRLLKEEFLYKSLCLNNYFEGELIIEKKPDTISYKQYFLQNVQVIKRYKQILNKIINKLVDNDKYDYFHQLQSQKGYLNDTVKLHTILAVTKQYYGKMPKDLLILYRVLNGQDELSETKNEIFEKLGIFGLMAYYNTYFHFVFNKFEKPSCHFLEDLQAYPFASIYPTQKKLFIDITNKLGFGHQTIYLFSPFKGQNGTYYFNIIHPTIDSFMNQLDRWNWNEQDQYLDLFDTLYQPGSDTTTDGIRIRATAKHVPMDQNNNIGGYFYSYSIRISANNIAKDKKYKLTKRKWIITQENQTEPDVVEGPGVIGYYPEIFDGCEDFVYQSCTVMHGYTGTMSGSFQFKDMQTKQLIEAQINPFPLRPDIGTKLISYNLQQNEINVIYETNE